MFSLCKQPLAFLQLFLGLLVVKGKSLRCINLQAATEGGHRLAKELDGLGALAPNTLFCERNAQVVLIQCPFFRGLLACRYLESAFQYSYRLDYLLCPSFSLRSLGSFCKCTAQTILNFCPPLWQLLAGKNLQGAAVGGRRPGKQLHRGGI